MLPLYILDGTETRRAELFEWARWFASANRRVAQNHVNGARVSTVFLGIDHNFIGKGAPVLFETMVFGGEHDGTIERYSTFGDAVVGHARIVARIAHPPLRLVHSR